MLSTLIPLFLFISNTQASSYADGGDDIACWKAKVMVDCKSIFPGVELSTFKLNVVLSNPNIVFAD